MKTKKNTGFRSQGSGASLVLMAFILQFSSIIPLAAAPFDCGSSGAYGAMNISNSVTLAMPPDGIFHCTTITVAAGATLTFSKNALNTPVYLLATGDVIINGTLDLLPNGRIGGPGGYDGGYGGSVIYGQSQGGDGCGPGGGINLSNRNGVFEGKYGNLLIIPLIGGSGSAGSIGSPGIPGKGGGGAVLIASNTRISIAGKVTASGQRDFNPPTFASGGAVRLVAPYVGGNGSIDVFGTISDYGSGGRGRIRIDCTDNQAYRSLSLNGGASRGNRMIVFPANPQYLDIIEVAGNAISQGTNAPALFELPEGASTNQTVKVQARGFTNDVPIRVVITPENGPRGEFDATILQSSGNPPFAIVPVVIPAGSACQVHAWTR